MGNKQKVSGVIIFLTVMLVLTSQKVFATELSREDVISQNTIEYEMASERATGDLDYEGFMPSIGNVKTLVLLVDFPSEPHDVTNTQEEIERSLNENAEGLKWFYRNSSYGKLLIDSEVMDWYTAEHDKDYYERIQEDGTLMESNDSHINPYGRQLLVHEVMKHFDQEVDFSKYDSDKDGYIDGIYIVFNGYTTGWNTLWWSCVSTEMDFGVESALTFDQVSAGRYIYVNNDALFGKTMIHETGHALGLADYYDYDTSSAESGIGVLDMMYGSLGDHNAFSKMQLGWLTPKVVTSATDISLRSIQEYPDAAIIYEDNDTTSDHFFLVEYITCTKNNELIPEIPMEGGVRVFRVNAALIDSNKPAKYTNYKFGYSDGEVPLIEAITDGNQYIWEKGVCTIGDAGQALEVFLWKNGAKISANGMPSTYNYGKNANELRYTGVQIERIKVDQGVASMYINYVPRDETKKFTYKIYKQATENLWVQLQCDSEVSLISSEDISFYDADGNMIDTQIEVEGSVVTKNRNLYFMCKKENLKPNSEYTLRIPAHRIKDVLGNENEEEIIVTLITPSFEKEVGAFFTNTKYQVSSPIQTRDNKIAIAVQEGGNLKLVFVHPETMVAERSVVYQNVVKEEESLSGIALLQKDDNQFLIRIGYVHTELCRVYLANLDGTIELIFERDSVISNSIALCESGFYLANNLTIWFYDFEKKTISEISKEKLGLDHEIRLCPLEGNQCLVIHNGSGHWDIKFLVLDNRLQILKGRKYRSGLFFGPTESVVNAVQYSDNTLAVFSLISNAKKTAGFITFYDMDLNLLNRIQVLDEGAFTGGGLSLEKNDKNLYIVAMFGNTNISALKEFGSGNKGYYISLSYVYNLNDDFTVNQILNIKNITCPIKSVTYGNDTFLVDVASGADGENYYVLVKYTDSNIPGNGFEDIPKTMEDVQFVSVFEDVTDDEQRNDESDDSQKGDDQSTASNNKPQIGDTVKDDKKTGSFKVLNTTTKELEYSAPLNKSGKTITIPSTVTINGDTYKVTKIGNDAFKNNKRITKVVIGNKVTTIGKNAFYGCTKLKKLTIGSNVRKIDAKAFYKCTSLTKVSLPSKVTKLGTKVFYGCKKLKTLIVKSTKLTSKSVSSSAFKGVAGTTTIKVPKKKVSTYKKLFKKKGLPSKVKVKKS